MNVKITTTVFVVALLVLGSLLYVSGGCLLYVKTAGTFYPDMESKRHKGAFEPYVAFFERFRGRENEFSLPVVCTPSAYRHDGVRMDTSDATKTMGYDRFESVRIELFKVEYESGDKQVLVSPDSSPRQYRVCNGAAADCGMDSRNFPEKYQLKKQEGLTVKIEGVALTVKGEKEEFSFQQDWDYKENLSVKSFVGAMP